MRFLKLVAALGLAMGLSVQAQAETPQASWQGFYVGAGGTRANAAHELDLSVPGPGSIINLDSLSSDGWMGVVQVGYDFRPSDKQPFGIGVFARYHGLGSADFSFSSPAAGFSILDASLEKQIDLGGRAFWVVPNANAIIFASAFYSKADLNWSLLGGALSGSQDLKGWGYGFGGEIMIAKNLSAAIEYTKTMFNDVDYDLGGATLSTRTDVDAVMVRLNFRTDSGVNPVQVVQNYIEPPVQQPAPAPAAKKSRPLK